jgi:hypothetical protein
MYHFIECPLHNKKLMMEACMACPHHQGLKSVVLIETIGSSGESLKGQKREMNTADVEELQRTLGTRGQVSELARYVECGLPRVLRIDTVHGVSSNG